MNPADNPDEIDRKLRWRSCCRGDVPELAEPFGRDALIHRGTVVVMSMNGELRLIPPELIDQLDDEEVVEGIVDGDGISVGKAWNGLHYLYCGDGSAGESAILGGIPLDHGDAGYGPPQYLTPDEVATYARQLEAMTDEKLREAYDAKAMDREGVYPGGWDSPDNLEWLLSQARSVREFYRDAAAKGAGVLQFLS